jgi:hypothetical protein
VAGAAASLLLPYGAGAQEDAAVEVVEVGWWSDRLGAVEQPGDGYEVGAGSDGSAQSLAALRLSLPDGPVQSLPVRLTETAGFTQLGGVLEVCTTTDRWSAADPGELADAPTPDCTTSTTLTRTLQGVWLGDLALLAPEGGEVSLMVVPDYEPLDPLPVGPGMTVTIATTEVAVRMGPAVPPVEGGVAPDVPVAPGSDVFFPTDPGSSFGVPPVGDLGLDPAQQVTTTTAAVPTDGADDFALEPITDEGGPPKPWWRMVILVPLSVGAGAGSVGIRRRLTSA